MHVHMHTRTHPESVHVPSSGDAPSPRGWVLTGVTTKDQLGKPDRLREKLQKLSEHGAFSGAQREGEMRGTSEETRQKITVPEGREREEEQRRRKDAERRREEPKGRK